jgi:hypothetical protein
MCNKQEATRTEHASLLIALLEADPFVCASDSTVESRWKSARMKRISCRARFFASLGMTTVATAFGTEFHA